MRALLDVNVLIALLDPDHIHHQRATDWLKQEIQYGWASCPITQNGCLRIMAQPAYPNSTPVASIAERLQRATSHDSHCFWPDDISLLDGDDVDWRRMIGHRQVTDVYLLALAAKQRGRFVTFDGRITAGTLCSAQPENLVALV